MPDVVVATFNLHGGVDGWGRPFDVAAACRSLEADVLVVEELWSPAGHDTTAELAEALGAEGHGFVMAPGRLRPPSPTADARWGPRWPRRHERGLRAVEDRGATPARRPVQGSPGTLGLGLFCRLPTRRVEAMSLGRMQGDRSRRGVLLADVEVAGRPLLVAGTHMSHLRHGSPVQFARLRRGLPSPSVTSAVVLGDMNLWGPPLALLLPGWHRAVRARTWPSWRPVAQSDHVLVSSPVAVRHGEVLRVGNSDHLAVRARLAIP